jgi:hypothetical protein
VWGNPTHSGGGGPLNQRVLPSAVCISIASGASFRRSTIPFALHSTTSGYSCPCLRQYQRLEYTRILKLLFFIPAGLTMLTGLCIAALKHGRYCSKTLRLYHCAICSICRIGRVKSIGNSCLAFNRSGLPYSGSYLPLATVVRSKADSLICSAFQHVCDCTKVAHIGCEMPCFALSCYPAGKEKRCPLKITVDYNS